MSKIALEYAEILDAKETLAEVMAAAYPEDLRELAKALCDLETSTIPNWDLQHAAYIRTALQDFVVKAATDVVNYR